MIPTINLRVMGKLPLFIHVIRLLLAFCLCFAAWFVACQRPRHAGNAGPPPAPQTAREHASGKVHFDLLAKLLAEDRRGDATNHWLLELADPQASHHIKTGPHALLDQPAPDFVLHDHQDRRWHLQEQLAHGPVIVVFYLGYACDRCVSNLFELNADLERFRLLGAEVVAVSGDSTERTQRRFAEYGSFRFPVLSDPNHVVAKSYGTLLPATAAKPQELMHATFLIGRNGRVHWVHCGATPFQNNKALLCALIRSENTLRRFQPSLQAKTRSQEQL
jgi:peroxiredoxin Q/BCP